MTQWLISDTHFSHANIIKYCSRPFRNTTDMDEVMISRWQHAVKPDDLIYHLGDVGYLKGSQVPGEPSYIEKVMARLPGKKILILGNHDKSAERMMELGFDFACESMMITAFGKMLYLNHRPLPLLPHGADRIIHGHIHNSTPESRKPYVHKGEMVEIPNFNINISVEMTNYAPVSLKALVEKIK